MEAINKLRNQPSLIGKVLCYIGIAVIVLNIIGFLLNFSSIVEMMEYSDELASMMVSSSLADTLMSIVAGFLLLGFSEIVRMLGIIANEDDGKWDVRKTKTYQMAHKDQQSAV